MENLIENNKLIAEFIGAFIEPGSNDRYNLLSYHNFPPAQNSNLVHTAIVCGAEDMQYHNSWDWLMPVVEKISKLPNHLHPDGLYRSLVSVELNFGMNCILIEDAYKDFGGNDVPTIRYHENSLIENIYKAVVQFIKWFTTQPK